MITGILLLYIGYKFAFPTLYFVGCWLLILLNIVKLIAGVYKAGRDNGK